MAKKKTVPKKKTATKKVEDQGPAQVDAQGIYDLKLRGVEIFTIIRCMEEGSLPGLTAKQAVEGIFPVIRNIQKQVASQRK